MILEGALTYSPFLCRIGLLKEKKMNRAKLKVLVSALRQILEELESEIYSDTDSYMRNKYSDYDEIFDDDDGYPD